VRINLSFVRFSSIKSIVDMFNYLNFTFHMVLNVHTTCTRPLSVVLGTADYALFLVALATTANFHNFPGGASVSHYGSNESFVEGQFNVSA
jgi:hypothetical protein